MIQVTKSEQHQIAPKCPSLHFRRSKHGIYMEERKDGIRELNIIRNSNIRSWKWAKITACAMALVLLVMLTACGRQDGTSILYQDNAVVVIREGHRTTVSDAISGAEYHFTAHRIRKSQTAEEAAQRAILRQVVCTNTMSIELVRDAIIIRELDTGKSVYIR